MKKQSNGASGFRRGWVVLLLSLAFMLPALSSEAFLRGEMLKTSFDRENAISQFASRVYKRTADLQGEQTRGGPLPASSVEDTAKVEKAKARLDAGYGRFPLLFEENGGQTDPEVAFTVKGSDKTLYFTPEGLAFSLAMPTDTGYEKAGGEDPASRRISSSLKGRERPGEESRERWTLKLDFLGAGRVRPEGEKPAETVISYFKGPESEHRSGVPTYNSIVYSDLWPGIDLVYDGDASHLKYRFVVRPGADPERIRLAYRGAERLNVNGDGGLEIVTAAGVLRDDAPVSWQETEEGRVPVNVSYSLGRSEIESCALDAPLDYGFSVDGYDPARELIIDPVVLVYCGFIGGSESDFGYGIAVDGARYVYVTGGTFSDERSFPAVVGPDLTHNGGLDAFVAKVNAAGTGLVYCGYIGGENWDFGEGIAVDGSGNAYVTGYTEYGETTFPVTVGPDMTHNGGGDAFVAKVNAAGTGLVYCGYIGGSGRDAGGGIAVDGGGNAYVTGWTESDKRTFPVKLGPALTHNGKRDAFVAKVNAAGTGLVYCGYIGGTDPDSGKGIAVDAWSNVYVTGWTHSDERTFPVTIGPDLTFNGRWDAFVAKVDAAGSELLYCGYIGGERDDGGEGVAVDGLGNAYVTGLANSNLWDDEGDSIAEDESDNAYVTGRTGSDETSFPVTVGPDLTCNGEGDAFVAKIGAVVPPPDAARMSDEDFRKLCAEGTAAEVRAAIEAGATVKGKKGEPTPLHWAGLNPKPGVISALLKAGADVNARSKDGTTPLHIAAANNSAAEAVSLLLKAGANANTRNRDGRTPLHSCAYGEAAAPVVEALLKAGADANARDAEGVTPLFFTVADASKRNVTALLLRSGADANAKDRDGGTPLHRAAASNTDPDVVPLLLKSGAKANARDKDGRTPLHLAARSNPNPVVTELLLKAGADAKAKDASGMRPIDYAEKNRSLRDTEAYWKLNDAGY
ncbi:MAG: Phosphocholine transferase AnkX [Synergistetes bacterium ADurb.BinA166]|nr:MAG: Phosphocholine transferase AnkX [Synergistetes bacterium ADurb.BinA166]